jgi:hypothetical protein
LDIDNDHFDLEPGDNAYNLSTTPHLIATARDKWSQLSVFYGR